MANSRLAPYGCGTHGFSAYSGHRPELALQHVLLIRHGRALDHDGRAYTVLIGFGGSSLVAHSVPSWNQISRWLRDLAALQRRAYIGLAS